MKKFKWESESPKPLYKVLNEKRTQGEMMLGLTTNLFFPDDVKEVRLNINGGKIASLTLEEGNEVSINTAKVNAQYIALAVNNFNKLTESLENIIELLDGLQCEQSGITITEQNIYKIAKEAIEKIK